MKEKDFDKFLDNLIIDGLIKEAEQDNVDFEAAIRNMSDEEFAELIDQPAYADSDSYVCMCEYIPETQNHLFLNYSPAIAPDDEEEYSRPIPANRSKWQVFRPWIVSAVVSAAVILIVLIPSINSMNDKLCDSALYASSEYIVESRSAFEIIKKDDTRLTRILPDLEKRYKDCTILSSHKTGIYTYSDDLQEAGWDLTLAYLKLHKKGDAVKVLKVLSEEFMGTPFGDHCQKMLEQL